MLKIIKSFNIKILILFNFLGFLLMSFIYLNNNQTELDFSKWDRLLKDHVDQNGVVDYKGFYDDKENLLEFTSYLSEHTPKPSWSKNQKKAYLINLYNANTIRLIIDNYPVQSIKDISGGFANVFKKKFIEFEGQLISLDEIEKKMLLPMQDARVHFAINCASLSCPKLTNYAFTPKILDEQLDKVTTEFVNSENVIVKGGKISVSKIFKWYEKDFKKAAGSVINFINQYSNHKLNSKSQIHYIDYSWNLNGVI